MAITAKDFTTLVREQVTDIQGTASLLIDVSVGSILRAAVEANAAVTMWLQGLIFQVLATTRAATSSGPDLDSWIADYGMTPRLIADYATGTVTLSRFTATTTAGIQIGAVVQTVDGVQFAVILDTTNPLYNVGLGAYLLGVSVSSGSVPVKAIIAGASGNAVIGAINTIAQAMPGIDTVTNAAAFVNGTDGETDAQLRLRFIAYVASLSKATKSAIGYAITSLQPGVTYTLTENFSYAGVAQPGYFYVVVDDGSGAPGSQFLTDVTNAVELVRGLTITFGVFAPVLLTANVSFTIITASGYDHATLIASANVAVTNFINGLGIGGSLFYSKLPQIIYESSPGITNVTGLTVNSVTVDLTATNKQIIKSGVITIT